MSEAAPDLHVGPSPDQASVEVPAAAPEQPAAPAVDSSAPASSDAAPATPDAAPVPTLEEALAEVERMKGVLEAYDAKQKYLEEQLALHAASNAVDAAAALKQIAALAAPFA